MPRISKSGRYIITIIFMIVNDGGGSGHFSVGAVVATSVPGS